MSSILKALKKLEREKSRQRDDHIDLARDILRGGERRSGRDWSTILVTAAIVVAVVVVTLIALRQMDRGDKAVESSVQLTVDRPVVSSPMAPAVVESVVEELIDQRRPQVRPPAPVRRTTTVRGEIPPVASIPKLGSEATVVDETLPPPVAAVAVPPAVAVVTAPPILPVRESFILSAIVFHPDREARIAVINDLPVMEGSMVGDYRVDEIQTERVILSREGSLFEVHVP